MIYGRLDPISNMLTMIRNAQAVKKDQVSVPFSAMKHKIANLLKEKGYFSNVELRKNKINKSEHQYIDIKLKYHDGQPALSGIKIISRPSRRMYIKSSEIRPIRSNYGFAIISTPKGIMDSKEARKNKLGGEIICEIW